MQALADAAIAAGESHVLKQERCGHISTTRAQHLSQLPTWPPGSSLEGSKGSATTNFKTTNTSTGEFQECNLQAARSNNSRTKLPSFSGFCSGQPYKAVCGSAKGISDSRIGKHDGCEQLPSMPEIISSLSSWSETSWTQMDGVMQFKHQDLTPSPLQDVYKSKEFNGKRSIDEYGAQTLPCIIDSPTLFNSAHFKRDESMAPSSRSVENPTCFDKTQFRSVPTSMSYSTTQAPSSSGSLHHVRQNSSMIRNKSPCSNADVQEQGQNLEAIHQSKLLIKDSVPAIDERVPIVANLDGYAILGKIGTSKPKARVKKINKPYTPEEILFIEYFGYRRFPKLKKNEKNSRTIGYDWLGVLQRFKRKWKDAPRGTPACMNSVYYRQQYVPLESWNGEFIRINGKILFDKCNVRDAHENNPIALRWGDYCDPVYRVPEEFLKYDWGHPEDKAEARRVRELYEIHFDDNLWTLLMWDISVASRNGRSLPFHKTETIEDTRTTKQKAIDHIPPSAADLDRNPDVVKPVRGDGYCHPSWFPRMSPLVPINREHEDEKEALRLKDALHTDLKYEPEDMSC